MIGEKTLFDKHHASCIIFVIDIHLFAVNWQLLKEKSVKTWIIKDNIVYSWQNGKMMTMTNDYISILRKYSELPHGISS